MTAATPAVCGHEHEYGGIAYRCERAPHPVDGHEERHRHAARIDAGYAREIGDVDGDGTPDLLTWEGDEDGDGDNTEVAWGTVASYGSGPVTAATADGFDSPAGRTYSEPVTGAEHYREAERLARKAGSYEGLPSNHHVQCGQLAQAHALLALVDAVREQTRELITPIETPERDW